MRQAKKAPKKGSAKTGKYADELSDEETCLQNYIPRKKLNDMTIDCDRLYIQPRSDLPSFPNIAIDIFFQYLAEAKGDERIAAILSGMGSDVSKGATMLKEKGGMVIFQTVQLSSIAIPESAIRTSSVDYKLLPE